MSLFPTTATPPHARRRTAAAVTLAAPTPSLSLESFAILRAFYVAEP